MANWSETHPRDILIYGQLPSSASIPWAAKDHPRCGEEEDSEADGVGFADDDDFAPCANTCCLVVLVLLVCIAAVLISVALVQQQPAWLQAGWDYRGRVCGVDSAAAGLPFLYWPDPGWVAYGLCLERCPGAEDVGGGSITYAVPRTDAPVTAPGDYDAGSAVVSQTARVDYLAPYPTLPALGRYCLPAPDEMLPVYAANGTASPQTATSMARAGDWMLPALRDSLGLPQQQLRRAVGGLGRVRWRLLLFVSSACLAVVLLVALGLRRHAVALLWAFIGAVCLLATGMAGPLLRSWLLTDTDFRQDTLNSLQVGGTKVGAGFLLLLVLAVALGAISFRSTTVRWSAACVRTTWWVLHEAGLLPQLCVVAMLTAAVQLAVSITALWWLQAVTSAASMPESPLELEGQLLAVRSVVQEPQFRWNPAPLLVVTFLALSVCLSFIALLERAVVCRIITDNYVASSLAISHEFDGDGGDGGSRTMLKGHQAGLQQCYQAWRATACSQLGSTLAGACAHVLLLAPLLRLVLVIAHKFLAPWGLTRCKCTKRLGLCIGRVIYALGAASAAQAAMCPEGCCDAAGAAAAAFATPAMRVRRPELHQLAGMPSVFGAAAAAAASLLAAFFTSLTLTGQAHDQVDYVESATLIVAVCGSLAAAPTAAVLAPLVAGFEAMLHCVAVNDLACAGGTAGTADSALDLSPGTLRRWQRCSPPVLLQSFLREARGGGDGTSGGVFDEVGVGEDLVSERGQARWHYVPVRDSCGSDSDSDGGAE